MKRNNLILLLLSVSVSAIFNQSLYAAKSNITQILCDEHQSSTSPPPRHQNNCDSLILALSCKYPEAGNFDGMQREDQEGLRQCITQITKSHGFDAANTEMAQRFYGDINELKPGKKIDVKAAQSKDGINRKRFNSYQLSTSPELSFTLGSLIIATKIQTPYAKKILALYDNRSSQAIRRGRFLDENGDKLRGSELKKAIAIRNKDREAHLVKVTTSLHDEEYEKFDLYGEEGLFKDNFIFGPNFDEKYNLGVKLSDPNKICKRLGYERAEESTISRNIISAATKNGMGMVYIDSTDQKDFAPKLKFKNDDAQAATGYRFFESITCIKLDTFYTDEQEDLYDDIESTLTIANPRVTRSALQFKTDDPHKHQIKVNNSSRKKTKKKQERKSIEWEEASIKSRVENT